MACAGCKHNPKKGLAPVTFVSREEAKRRMAICRPCENWLFGICRACGCSMFIKTKLETFIGQEVICEHKEGNKWKQA